MAMRAIAALLAVAAFGLASCQSDTGGGPADGALRVALLTPGPISDGGWNASAYDGLQRIKRELGAEVSNVQVSNPAEFEQGFRDYAQQGFNLVIGHGFEFQDAALKVGKEFPKTDFVVSSGSVEAKNVASITFHLGQATYLAGILAASMSKSGRAGCVGGIKLPVITSTFNGFEAGAKSVNPGFVVATSYTGSFEDVAAARTATDALIAQGADFILQNADAAGIGVFQSAKQHGVFAFGTNRDQSDISPDTVLASATISIAQAFVDVAKEVKEHRFAGRVIVEGLASGTVGFVFNPKLKDQVPPGVLERIAVAEQRIKSGDLKVAP